MAATYRIPGKIVRIDQAFHRATETRGALPFFCVRAGGPILSVVHTSAGSDGVQEAGKDARPTRSYGSTAPKPETVTLQDVEVERDDKLCAAMTNLERIATISANKQTAGLLRVDANKGTRVKRGVGKERRCGGSMP